MKYNFTDIEKRWQTYWENNKTFHAPNPGEKGFDKDKQKFYVLDMFPYPSGVGLHVGHPLGYIATDIAARYKKMCGFNVLHPIGYDAFGLPAEQYAVETGIHPRQTTEKNIANMTRQLKRLGLGYDWDRTVSTTDPKYYKWTQWIFLKLFNSWFDQAQGKARPISDLLWMLDSERLYVAPNGDLVAPSTLGMGAVSGSPIGTRKWIELDEYERRQIIDNQRLAYIDQAMVNWCPALGTVLANEEVTNEGQSERGNHPVYQRPLKQWMLRITAYCDRLDNDLDLVDWPGPVKVMQRNWIGKSLGAKVDFPIIDNNSAQETGETLTIFTTRPDTLFGATYMVVAPEHELVEQVTTPSQRTQVEQYQKQAQQKSAVDRQADERKKTGVFTGGYAINPLTEKKVPIWIADYVMTGYGTGAIMAVPAHDQRDFDFARKFEIDIIPVVLPPDAWLKEHYNKQDRDTLLDAKTLRSAFKDNPGNFDKPFTGEGTAINSANSAISFDGLSTVEVKSKINQYLKETDLGRITTQYRLRDWLFSRQRYWGEPFPILYGEDGQIVALDESELPLTLPEMDQFKPLSSDDPNQPPKPPLSNAPFEWRNVTVDGKQYTRELNTMPQWAGSCWYYLRYLDPDNNDFFAGEEIEKYWMAAPRQSYFSKNSEDDKSSKSQLSPRPGIDLYVGGAEHAVLHLLYSRFWHKVLFDLGYVSTPEPFGRLFNQGYIQAYAYTDKRGVYVPASEVEEKDDKFFYQGEQVTREFGKMGKSLKNAIAPDEIGEQYGFDTLRLYEMYLGPLEQSKVWNTRDIVGVHRFLQRLWRNFVDEESGEFLVIDNPADEKLLRKINKTIQRVTEAMESLSFNVAIAALIEMNNDLVALDKVPREIASLLVRCLAPLAPHIAEELWQKLGEKPSVSTAPWPEVDPKWLVEEEIEYPVQINGKVKGHIKVAADASNSTIEQAACADQAIAQEVQGQTIQKIIVIPKRMVSIVAK